MLHSNWEFLLILNWLAKLHTGSQWHSCIADVNNRSSVELLTVFCVVVAVKVEMSLYSSSA